MHPENPLASVLLLLVAAVIAVPLFKRFRLGAILGYLFAGVLIGPQVLHLISDPHNILHYSEIGVVLLLFVIGLELNPERLWSMRRQIGLLGGGQILLTSLLIFLIACSFLAWKQSMILGLALSLSSTAFAVQLMAEKGVLASSLGRRGFSILLMQDLAVIPILLVLQLFSDNTESAQQPWWVMLMAVTVLLFCGRYLLNPLLTIVARFGSRETMTATALLIVIASAYLMYLCGLSMGMGAFVAGIMLANSHFRHQLETDIEPFKGLGLGLFFIAIGMTLDLQLLIEELGLVLLLSLGLVFIKVIVISVLLRFFKTDWRSAINMGLMLGQGGEFAFVIMSQAVMSGLVQDQTAAIINLIVGVSMALTSPLVSLYSLWVGKKKPSSDDHSLPSVEKETEVMILGFGRFGQITGRILAANNIPFTALDNNPTHIQFIKRFGNTVHFGDISRLDVLQAAGIDNVHTILVTIEDGEKSVALVRMIREHYPDVIIVARAYNRVNYLRLVSAGANKVIREMFSGSLEAALETLTSLGFTSGQALHTVDLFKQHDEALLERALEHHDDMDKLIEIGVQGRKELEDLFKHDKESISSSKN